jgi:hypothetical protein
VWVSAERLRAFVAAPIAAPAVAGLPQSVPEGLYTCVTYGTVNMTVGKLRIASNNSSSAIIKDGSGAQHRYAYDVATGAITWAEGMKIAGWTVESALYRPSADGRPNINLHYRLREGGNLNSMSCQRE